MLLESIRGVFEVSFIPLAADSFSMLERRKNKSLVGLRGKSSPGRWRCRTVSAGVLYLLTEVFS